MPWNTVVTNLQVSDRGTAIGPVWPSPTNPVGFTIVGPSGRGNRFDVIYSFPPLIAASVRYTFYGFSGETYTFAEGVVFPSGTNSLILGIRSHPSDVVWRVNVRFWA